MTILVTADLHLTDNPRDAYRHKFVARLPGIAKQYNTIRIIILGDLTEEKDRHSSILTNRIVEHITAIASVCPVTILRGNHDAIDADQPFFHFLDKLPGVEWKNHPDVWVTDFAGLRGKTIFLPYTGDYKRDWQGVDFKKVNFIFTHNTFEGANVGHGRRMAGIPLSVFPKGARVISGDVHRPQTLGPITYVGAPYTIDFGDDYKPRFLLIDGDKLRSIAPSGPQKRLIEIADLDDLDKQAVNEGDILKVRVSIAQDQHANWPAMREAVQAWGDQNGYMIHLVQPIVDSFSPNARNRKAGTPKSDKQVLEAYAKVRGVDDRTLGTGVRIMEEK